MEKLVDSLKCLARSGVAVSSSCGKSVPDLAPLLFPSTPSDTWLNGSAIADRSISCVSTHRRKHLTPQETLEPSRDRTKCEVRRFCIRLWILTEEIFICRQSLMRSSLLRTLVIQIGVFKTGGRSGFTSSMERQPEKSFNEQVDP